MGANQSAKARKEYLRCVEKEKRDFFQTSESLSQSDGIVKLRQNWKELLIQEILDAQDEFPTARWPHALHKVCSQWAASGDHRWRSNVLWFEFLQNYKANERKLEPVSATTLQVGLNASTDSFEATSLVQFIRPHLEHRNEHLVAAMLETFKHHIVQEFREGCWQRRCTDAAVVLEQFIAEVRCFLALSLRSLVFFYGPTVGRQVKEMTGEMYNLVLEFAFNSEVVATFVSLHAQANAAELAAYTAQLELLQGLTCEEIGMESSFQLDLNRSDGLTGYEKAVDKLSTLTQANGPLQVLTMIQEVTHAICQCVDDYYKDTSEENSNLVISAEAILGIFSFLLIKAGLAEIRSYLALITHFGRRSVKQGPLGYYLITIESCVLRICSMSR